MRYLGMLLTLVIICILVVIIFRSVGITPSGGHDAEWYYQHPTERASQLQWCQQNPQQQNSGECLAAVTAQTRVDTEAVTPGR